MSLPAPGWAGDQPLPPWDLYRFTFRSVAGLSTVARNCAMRWRFG